MASVYDYLFLTLTRPGARRELARHIKDNVAAAMARDGGEVVGLFAPNFGWASNQAAALVRWTDGAAGRATPLTENQFVASVHRERLTATLRPSDDDRPPPGRIYVHRWIEIDADTAGEFITLSGEAWRSLEVEFRMKVFGLFRAEADLASPDPSMLRLFLLTSYADYSAWQAQFDPASKGRQILYRRDRLMRRTWAASSVLEVG